MVCWLALALAAGCTRTVYVVREVTSGTEQQASGAEPPMEASMYIAVEPSESSDAERYPTLALRAPTPPRAPTFADLIRQVCAMPGDPEIIDLAFDAGLSVSHVAWEDTGRSAGSVWGPNISDVTLAVYEDPSDRRNRPHLLPVIRHPNFRDLTADVPADRFSIRVGNAREGMRARNVPLARVLAHVGDYLGDPSSVYEGRDDFRDARDTHYLVSAQFVFVPLSESGVATFAPHIFNYESRRGSPAVMTLVATREGTSITVVENVADRWGAGRGETLYFNANGTNALYTAERRTSVAARVASGEISLADDPTLLDQNADVMLIVQVPVRLAPPPPPPRLRSDPSLDRLLERSMSSGGGGGASSGGSGSSSGSSGRSSGRRSDVEAVVVGHAELGGRFEELRRRDIRRDPRFPVRVTVQFYRATSNGVISAADMAQVRATLDRVYSDADYIGSLVTDRPRRRATETH